MVIKSQQRKVYVASSWRNLYQPTVVNALKNEGHQVYDFRHEAAFSWAQIDKKWKDWTIEQYMRALEEPQSIIGFNSDFGGVKWCDVGVLVLPCGLSAGIEAGFIKGSGKPVLVYVPEMREAELMIKCFDRITPHLSEILAAIPGPQMKLPVVQDSNQAIKGPDDTLQEFRLTTKND